MLKWKSHTSPAPSGDRMTQEQIAEAIKVICLQFGASVHTAFKVAGTFVEGLDKNRKEPK